MNQDYRVSRRSGLKSMGALGAAALLATPGAGGSTAALASDEDAVASEVRKTIAEKVANTTFVDTHEHLFEERVRLDPETSPFVQLNGPLDDWSILIGGYTFSDLISAGLPVNATNFPRSSTRPVLSGRRPGRRSGL
jgi:hypothetical protein